MRGGEGKGESFDWVKKVVVYFLEIIVHLVKSLPFAYGLFIQVSSVGCNNDAWNMLHASNAVNLRPTTLHANLLQCRRLQGV